MEDTYKRWRCFSADDCYWRSTSKTWPPVIEDAVWGFMSNDTKTNPEFANWNTIYIEYCDGTSFSGDRDQPVIVRSTPIYLRGKRILAALLDNMEQQFGLLTKSSAIILTGTSAGGLSTYLHSEYLYSRINPTVTKVYALPDAGFFLDHQTTTGIYRYRQQFQSAVVALWNATGGVDQACIADNPVDQWKCFFAQYAYPYIKHVPVFITNSLYDTFQTSSILQLGCDPGHTGNCTDKQLSEFQQYRDDMLTVLSEVTNNPRDGYFLNGCYQHESSCQDIDFMGIKINGQTALQTFSNWYFQKSSATKLFDVRWPNDATCRPADQHGPC